jgi:acetyltransferase
MKETQMTTSDGNRAEIIQRLLKPQSIAIVGASDKLDKVNGRPLKHLMDKGYAGRILPVNPKYEQIEGHDCYPTISDLPEIPDLTIIALPARFVADALVALGEKGGKAAVIFSSGFGETGAEGQAMETQLQEISSRFGMCVMGPNCLGFINAFEKVYATFSQYADGATGDGPIAFVTQSGAFGTAIASLVRQRGLGLGYFINTGNQADLDFSELMMGIVEDPRIKVAAGYLEGVKDGPALVRLAKRCRELGKPLILTKVGRMESGAKAAASHTGALAMSDAVFDAVIRQYGVIRARNEEQMLDIMEAFCQPRRPAGNRVGIATQSGGAGVMMADRAEEVGLEIPQLGSETQQRILDVMPEYGAAGNPVDVTGQFVARPELLSESVVAMLDDPDVDIAIVWLQLMTAHVDKLVNIFADIQARTKKPFFVCWVAAPQAALEALRNMGIPTYTAGERSIEAAAALIRYSESASKTDDSVMLTGNGEASVGNGNLPAGALDSVSAVDWLTRAGIPMAPVSLATSEDSAVELWQRTGGPVVLKVESPDILHKTEIGGVVLNLNGEPEIRQAYNLLVERARNAHPKADLKGILVQPMSSGHVELVVGVSHDPVFGMIVMVGLGGILVEVLKDVTFRHAPFDRNEAARMLDELKTGVVLDGVRGKPAVDRGKIADLLSRLSVWAASMEGRLSELDLNPVLVSEDGPVVVDCVMILDASRQDVAA